MVKHGRDRKRRAGRIGRTKLKNRSWVRWDPKLKVAKELRDHWDRSKSPAANLESMGLVANPNQLVSSTTSRFNDSRDSKKLFIELFDVPDSDALDSEKKQRPMDLDQEEYICKCMMKWGDDYVAMFRDIKVNNLQHTEQRLRKLGARYLLLSPEERHFDVPEKVSHLVPGSY